MIIENRIKELGFQLPSESKAIASYVPAKRAGNLVFTSGQLPIRDGELISKGIISGDSEIELAYECAQICVLNALTAIRGLIGDLDEIKQVVKVVGFVASSSNFFNQPKVVNGASELLIQIFGEKGKHSRSAVGVAALPLNATVEIELIVEI